MFAAVGLFHRHLQIRAGCDWLKSRISNGPGDVALINGVAVLPDGDLCIAICDTTHHGANPCWLVGSMEVSVSSFTPVIWTLSKSSPLVYVWPISSWLCRVLISRCSVLAIASQPALSPVCCCYANRHAPRLILDPCQAMQMTFYQNDSAAESR